MEFKVGDYAWAVLTKDHFSIGEYNKLDQGIKWSLDDQIGGSNSMGSKAIARFTHEEEIVEDMCKE